MNGGDKQSDGENERGNERGNEREKMQKQNEAFGLRKSIPDLLHLIPRKTLGTDFIAYHTFRSIPYRTSERFFHQGKREKDTLHGITCFPRLAKKISRPFLY